MKKQMIFTKYLENDVADLETYRALGGLSALEKVNQMESGRIRDEIKKSLLCGRAGAGFPTGLKMEMAAQHDEKQRYVICNADEGEVGTFKDRELLKSCPYLVLEGLVIACRAVGAQKGFIYLRDEYSYLAGGIAKAAGELERSGWSTGEKGCSIQLRVGAGAYICGEETALLESLEGRRGEPRLKPPYPTQEGLFGKPTVIINVETLANLPWIITHGAEAFTRFGTEVSRGTKLFSISGDVKRPGVYEFPLGTKLRVLVEHYAGAEQVKAVQVGGASGRIVAGTDLDRSLCFEDVLGSGSVVVFDSSRSMVESMRENMAFFMAESCGKCTPCREGTFLIHAILEKLCRGEGRGRDLDMMKEIASSMTETSFCGLGIAAPTSLMDALQLFEEEFQQAVESRAVAAGG